MTTVKSNYDAFTNDPSFNPKSFEKAQFEKTQLTQNLKQINLCVKTDIRRDERLDRHNSKPGNIISMYGLSCFDT